MPPLVDDATPRLQVLAHDLVSEDRASPPALIRPPSRNRRPCRRRLGADAAGRSQRVGADARPVGHGLDRHPLGARWRQRRQGPKAKFASRDDVQKITNRTGKLLMFLK